MRLGCVCADACALQHLYMFCGADPGWLREHAKFVIVDIVEDELKGQGCRRQNDKARPQNSGVEALTSFFEYGLLVSPVFKTGDYLTDILSLSKAEKIDLGEAACIRICEVVPHFRFLTDDARAKRVAESRLGKERVISTFDLVLLGRLSGQVSRDWVARGCRKLEASNFCVAESWPEQIEAIFEGASMHLGDREVQG